MVRASMAQLVEQRIRNAWVAGSNPARSSKENPLLFEGFPFFLK